MSQQKELTPGQQIISDVMIDKGFTSAQVNNLLSVGYVVGPEDLPCTLNSELISAGFTPRQVNQLRQFFSRSQLAKRGIIIK